MNKTINANIGGVVFHIDEDAYHKLHSYLEALKGHFRNNEGGSEIVNDIEARMGEMLEQKTSGRQIVNIKDVEEVIAQMGMPEDFEDPGQEFSQSSPPGAPYGAYAEKRFFRNPDDKILGGVCSGISAYFGVDPLWLRLITVIAVLFFGTGILIYLILWIIIPEAKTPGEKLQMRGENVTISNIEKTVREEAEAFKKKLNSFTEEAKRYPESEQFQRTRNSLGDFLEDVGQFLGKAIGIVVKVAGAFVIAICLIILISFFLGMVGVSTAFSISYPVLVKYLFETNTQAILSGIALFLTVAIPAIWAITAGIIYLTKAKVRTRYINLSFMTIWISGLILSAYVITQIVMDFRVSGVNKETVVAETFPYDTLYVNLKQPEIYEYDDDIVQADFGNVKFYDDTIILSDIDIRLENSDDKNMEITLYKVARGETRMEARARANRIKYSFVLEGNILNLDPSYTIGHDVWRDQKIRIRIKVPATVYVEYLGHAEYYTDDHDHNYRSAAGLERSEADTIKVDSATVFQ